MSCRQFYDQLILEQNELQTQLQTAVNKKLVSNLTKQLKNIQTLINAIHLYNAFHTIQPETE